ncbi:MAG TPA: glycosyltransferase family 4 protein [Anaerohalosphaeraceae bacterium]|nr:glycosyltransferase family 4 protein [Anaerohalosphaeraceae bacterium]
MSMSSHGFRVKIILLHGSHPENIPLPGGFEQLSIPARTNVFTRRRYLRECLSEIPDNEPVVIHDTFMAQLGLEVRHRFTLKHRKANIRNVLSLYSTAPSYLFQGHWIGDNKEYKARLREWPYYLKKYVPIVCGEMLSCQLADMVTGNSQEVVDGVQKYYRLGPERTRFVSAEIDTEYYVPGPSKRQELELPEEGKILLYAGKFQRQKGIDVLLKAFDRVAAKNPKAYLVMLGEPGDTGYMWYKDLLDSLPCRDRILIRKPVKSNLLRDYYRSCDVFVMPTYHEGSPRVVKEAMACGLPVVASLIEGNLAIDPEQKSLVLLRDWQPGLYADAVEKVLEDEAFRDQRIEAGLTAAQHLSPERVALRYMDLYKSLF